MTVSIPSTQLSTLDRPHAAQSSPRRSVLGLAAVPLTVVPLIAAAAFVLPTGAAATLAVVGLPVAIAVTLLAITLVEARRHRSSITSLEAELTTERERAEDLDTVVAHLHEGVVIVEPETQTVCFRSSRAADLIGRNDGLPAAIVAGLEPKPRRRAADQAHPDGTPFTAVIDGRPVDCTPRRMPAVDGRARVALILTDATERQRQQSRLSHLMTHDRVTGLLDRDALRRTLVGRLDTRDTSGPFALLMVDIDGFRTVNARLGNVVGDRVLEAFGRRLKRIVRDTDVVARVDGDMFAIIQAGAGQPMQVQALAMRLATELAKPHLIAGMEVELPVTVGAAIATEAMLSITADHLLAQAEVALIEAKAIDAGRFRLHNDSE